MTIQEGLRHLDNKEYYSPLKGDPTKNFNAEILHIIKQPTCNVCTVHLYASVLAMVYIVENMAIVNQSGSSKYPRRVHLYVNIWYISYHHMEMVSIVDEHNKYIDSITSVIFSKASNIT